MASTASPHNVICNLGWWKSTPTRWLCLILRRRAIHWDCWTCLTCFPRVLQKFLVCVHPLAVSSLRYQRQINRDMKRYIYINIYVWIGETEWLWGGGMRWSFGIGLKDSISTLRGGKSILLAPDFRTRLSHALTVSRSGLTPALFYVWHSGGHGHCRQYWAFESQCWRDQ